MRLSLCQHHHHHYCQSQPTSNVEVYIQLFDSLMITMMTALETDRPWHANDENILTFWLAVCLSVTYVPVVTRTLKRAISI